MKKYLLHTVAIFATFFITHIGISQPVNIEWLGGASGPRNDLNFSSISWDDFSENLIYAVKNELTTYDKTGEIIEIVSDLPDDSTVLEIMNSKQNTGEISFTGKEYDGLGFFVESINEIGNIPAENTYWAFYIDGVKSNDGISSQTINTGQTVRWVLDSASNDKVVIEDNLGNYDRVLGTNINPFWNGVFLSSDAYPIEKGQGWNEIIWITTHTGATFVPNNVEMTIYVEKWDFDQQIWVTQSSQTVDPTNSTTINQSFLRGDDETPGTSDDIPIEDNSQSSESFIFSSTGITFLPTGQGVPEPVGVSNTKSFLLDNKVRLRFRVEIPFHYSDETLGLYTGEKIVYKQAVDFSSPTNQILSISDFDSDSQVVTIQFNSDSSSDLLKVERSSDLKNWYPFKWKSGSGLLEQKAPGDKNFFRATKY